MGNSTKRLFLALSVYMVIVICIFKNITFQSQTYKSTLNSPQFLSWQRTFSHNFTIILLWGSWFGIEWPHNLDIDHFRNCPERECVLTTNHDKAREAAVLIFHAADLATIPTDYVPTR